MNEIESIFGEKIEKTVFISDEQLHDGNIKALYGRYFEDTSIFNVFPAQLSDRGEHLCDVLAPNEDPETRAGFCAVFTGEQLEFYYDGNELKYIKQKDGISGDEKTLYEIQISSTFIDESLLQIPDKFTLNN